MPWERLGYRPEREEFPSKYILIPEIVERGDEGIEGVEAYDPDAYVVVLHKVPVETIQEKGIENIKGGAELLRIEDSEFWFHVAREVYDGGYVGLMIEPAYMTSKTRPDSKETCYILHYFVWNSEYRTLERVDRVAIFGEDDEDEQSTFSQVRVVYESFGLEHGEGNESFIKREGGKRFLYNVGRRLRRWLEGMSSSPREVPVLNLPLSTPVGPDFITSMGGYVVPGEVVQHIFPNPRSKWYRRSWEKLRRLWSRLIRALGS